ncbi:MAG TPA: glutamate--tRNA ligase family protein, partial [Propionicimonas sp.]|nr:glutamate--tRNA ligase family protein [Propionicimonas sp.]
MNITHVVRGEEWISSTPKHLLLYRWLGWDEPAYALMPLLRNTDKSKISKRKNPAARLTWFLEQGYLPEALRNFLQLLAYPPVDEEHEVSTFDDFVANFEWTKVNTVGPIFDLKKLDWLNGHYIRSLGPEELADRIIEFGVREGQWPADAAPEDVDRLRRAVPLVQERLVLLSEALPKLAYLFTPDAELKIDADTLAQAGDDAPNVVSVAIDALSGLGEWSTGAIQDALRTALVDGLGIKPKFAFGPVRLAITGSKVSPPLFESMELLGRDASLTRLELLRAVL